MRSTFPALSLDKSQPVYQQIGQQLRSAIHNKKLPCGTRLPSAQALARQFKTSVFTVQSALTPLVQDGLLKRTPRRGTFVCAHPHRLTSVGIYFGSDFWSHPSLAFYRKLYQELIDELERRGIQHRTWIDSRLKADHKSPLPEIETSINNHEIQGVIAGLVHDGDRKWLEKLKVPTSQLHSVVAANTVGFDMSAVATQGLQELHRLKCRTVGVIVPFTHQANPKSKVSNGSSSFFPALTQTAKQLRLVIKEQWMITPTKPISGSDFEAFGYQAFRQLCQQPGRPEGLLVYPDTIARGVILAALESGIKIPGDLKLVLHRNDGIPVFCPFQASWLVSSVQLTASALIDQLSHQLTSKASTPILLPLKLGAQDRSAKIALSHSSSKKKTSVRKK